MSRQLEEQLARVPERWRDVTRTRAYAVKDYLAAGEDGSLLVDVLCRRTELSRSAFYTLVRRWKKAEGNVSALVPWARGADTKPRVSAEATARIDAVAGPMIARDPRRPTEPVAQHVLATWPNELPRPGVSYVRRRVDHLRAEHEKKTRRTESFPDGSRERRAPRWPLDVIAVDHVAVEVVVWDGDMPTIPIVTLAIDAASGRALAARLSLDQPTPNSVAAVLRELAAVAVPRHAPGPPTIGFATTHAPGWSALIEALTSAGADVAPRRSKRLSFGSLASDLLGGRLCGYRLAPRLGHRPKNKRITARALLGMEHRTLAEFDAQVQGLIAVAREELVNEEAWPPAATAAPQTWQRLAALT